MVRIVTSLCSIIFSCLAFYAQIFHSFAGKSFFQFNSQVAFICGLLVALFMLIAGIIGLLAKNIPQLGFLCCAFWIIASVLSFFATISYSSYFVRSLFCVIFAFITLFDLSGNHRDKHHVHKED